MFLYFLYSFLISLLFVLSGYAIFIYAPTYTTSHALSPYQLVFPSRPCDLQVFSTPKKYLLFFFLLCPCFYYSPLIPIFGVSK